jgi:hypothetical protein
VTQQNFNTCSTTNVLKSYTNGNTTISLSKPGPRYFISGNKLYCLGGMKLQVNVENNQAYSPASAPQPATGSGATHPQPSSKKQHSYFKRGYARWMGYPHVCFPWFYGYCVILSWSKFDFYVQKFILLSHYFGCFWILDIY